MAESDLQYQIEEYFTKMDDDKKERLIEKYTCSITGEISSLDNDGFWDDDMSGYDTDKMLDILHDGLMDDEFKSDNLFKICEYNPCNYLPWEKVPNTMDINRSKMRQFNLCIKRIKPKPRFNFVVLYTSSYQKGISSHMLVCENIKTVRTIIGDTDGDEYSYFIYICPK